MPADPVDEAADRLYGVPFDDFVAERTAAAKALRQAGERDAAAQVAKLPKPSQVAWVANMLAREGADELLEAGEALREAQLGGGGRDAVREAAAAEREAVDALLRRAADLRPLSRDAVDRLRALLHAVAADEELRRDFSAGRLVSEPEPSGWPLGGVVAPASTSTAASKEGRTKAPPRRERESADVRRRREERERKAAERREREAARKREEAERRKLERRLAAARDRANAARERLEAAKDAYEAAVDEVARIEEQLS